jgi:hypothetical protein
MNIRTLLIALALFNSCVHHPRGGSQVNSDAPYTDSTGYRFSLARVEATNWQESSALISQALSVAGDTLQTDRQPDFFQSLEESYQRYLPLFAREKNAPRPQVRCTYDLVETFRLGIFDAQPFVNALLHTMSITEVSTLDYTARQQSADTTTLLIKVTKAVAPEKNLKELRFTEGDAVVSVTRHRAELVSISIP